MHLHISSKMYDTRRADINCSTTHNRICSLNVLFPNTRYMLLTTPNNITGGANTWYIELSFVARLVTYVIILGFVVIIIFVILKYLGACEAEEGVEVLNENRNDNNENQALLVTADKKSMSCLYGSVEEDDKDLGLLCGSSDDLYDGKICVICYDQQRDCFFVPCGHCATCFNCAQRIESGERNCCPICRRQIHKVRRLINP